MKQVFCVRWSGGVCATRSQSATYRIKGDSLPTLCGWRVILPGPRFLGRPTCPECKRKLKAKEDGR